MQTAPQWQPFTTHAGKRGQVQHWPSLTALASHIDANRDKFSGYSGKADYYGASSALDAAKTIKRGDLTGAQEARELVDRISVSADTKRRTWSRAVAGGFPIVPEYLGGSPLCMRRRTMVRVDTAPLTIWLGLSVSQGTDRSTMRKRAIGAMALALSLSSLRQVRVVGYCGMGDARKDESNFVTFPLDADADMAGVFLALAHPVVSRLAAFNLHFANGGNYDIIPWPWNQLPRSSDTGDPAIMPNIRDALGAGADDVILGGGHLDDSDFICRDPAGWVQKMLAKYGAVADAEAA